MVVTESMQEYLSNPAKGSSDIIKINGATPLEWITNVHLAKGEKESTSSQKIGTLVHSVCENVRLDILGETTFIKQDERRTGNKELNQQNALSGKLEVTPNEIFTAMEMGKNILNKPKVVKLLSHKDLKHEQSIYTTLNGLPIKIRPDITNFVSHYIVSIKSTTCLAYEGKDGFQREMDKFHYWSKECFYALAYEKEFGVFPQIYMLVTQNKSPYDCYIMQLNIHDLKSEIDFVNGCIANVIDVLRDYNDGKPLKGIGEIYGDKNDIIHATKYDWRN